MLKASVGAGIKVMLMLMLVMAIAAAVDLSQRGDIVCGLGRLGVRHDGRASMGLRLSLCNNNAACLFLCGRLSCVRRACPIDSGGGSFVVCIGRRNWWKWRRTLRRCIRWRGRRGLPRRRGAAASG